MTESFKLENNKYSRPRREMKAGTFLVAAVLLLAFSAVSWTLGMLSAFAEDASAAQLKRNTSPEIRALFRDNELEPNREYSLTLKLMAGGFFVGATVSLLMWANRRDTKGPKMSNKLPIDQMAGPPRTGA